MYFVTEHLWYLDIYHINMWTHTCLLPPWLSVHHSKTFLTILFCTTAYECYTLLLFVSFLRRVHHKQGLQEKNLSKARFSTFQVAQSKNTYMWAVLTHWLLQLRVNLHFPRRYWPMGCCFLVGSRFYRRFKRWYKGLKSRVVQVKYEEKGVTLLWI